MAFKGNFIIDFAISDTEFSIPVYKNGVKNGDDIKECSQGEISMVKTSLSLGIVSEAIKSSTNGYNIACLDEIDAELDKKNRAAFTEILDRQLDSLDSEQCFIITHNDAFMASRAALILLPGNTVDKDDELFMNNKDVVFEF
jgi:DNA repair exonuclease SbcCD ATPase subunit